MHSFCQQCKLQTHSVIRILLPSPCNHDIIIYPDSRFKKSLTRAKAYKSSICFQFYHHHHHTLCPPPPDEGLLHWRHSPQTSIISSRSRAAHRSLSWSLGFPSDFIHGHSLKLWLWEKGAIFRQDTELLSLVHMAKTTTIVASVDEALDRRFSSS